MTSPEDPDVVDWNDLSEDDKKKAQNLLHELNLIMDKYLIKPQQKSDDVCEDSILDD